jgi:hypothetical protein
MDNAVFTLPGYEGNAFMMDGNVLLSTAIFINGNVDHSQWGEVSLEAFDSESEYDALNKLARNDINRISIKEVANVSSR